MAHGHVPCLYRARLYHPGRDRMPNPINGMDTAAAALRYWERKQEIVANNLANVSTDGFKAQRVFARLLDGTQPVPDTTSDLSAGALRQTGSALDLSLEKDGFFVVQTRAGERYTRGGSFSISLDHQLVDADGHTLLGANGPVVVGDGPIQIDKSGGITQNGSIVDTLRVERAPGRDLDREGGTLFVPPSRRNPVPDAERTVTQGWLEDSNVNSMTSMVDMVSVQRAYASVQKAILEIDRTYETAVSEIGKPL
jgi:flagellar basal-body rod protein FlgF